MLLFLCLIFPLDYKLSAAEDELLVPLRAWDMCIPDDVPNDLMPPLLAIPHDLLHLGVVAFSVPDVVLKLLMKSS